MTALRHIITVFLLVLTGCETAIAADGDETARGIVRAIREVSVSTDLFAKVSSLPFQEGQRFTEGDVLIAFDCTEIEVRHKSASARQSGEQLTYDNLKYLKKLNAAGEFDVELQRTKLDQAIAEAEGVANKLKQCTIHAPFDGNIVSLHISEHEFPDRERPLMQIIDPGTVKIELLLPAIWLQWLKPYEEFNIRIEETGNIHSAVVTRILPVIDPVSQTIKVVGRFTGDADNILPGMSGPASFRLPDE